MRGRLARLALGLSAAALCSGCVAAIIPIAAGGAIANAQLKKKQAAARAAQATAAPTALTPAADLASTTIQGTVVHPTDQSSAEHYVIDRTATTLPAPTSHASARPTTAEAPDQKVYLTKLRDLPAPDRVQAPAADTSPLISFALAKAARWRTTPSPFAVLLVEGARVEHPEFMPCRRADPPAVIFDIDQAGRPLTSASLPEISGIAPAGVERLRKAGVHIIWLSGRSADRRPKLVAALQLMGLYATSDTLSLSRSPTDRKQLQRWDSAHGYCVIAIKGDKRGDFDELFDYLRSDDSAAAFQPLWGKGWFLSSVTQSTHKPNAEMR